VTALPKPFYQSERVTVYNGDCLSVLQALPEKTADMVFTDPPYGHNNNNGDLIANREKALGKKKAAAAPRPICNDGEEADGIFLLFLYRAKKILKDDCCCCCCCCGGGPDPMFARWSLAMDRVMTFRQQVVWDKGPIGMGWQYRRSTECVLVATKGKKKMRWFDDSHKVENIIRPGMHGIRKIIPSARQHPTEKPVALPSFFIRLHSLAGETVVDPFMGHGSTGSACLKLGRKFIGIELDMEHCERAVERLRREEAAL
jgi:site-specific DNA-methyltransferase (adenine-specific)